MAHFQGVVWGPPFGKNVFLRSTHPEPTTESYTFGSASMPTITIGTEVTKVLQPGTVLASITSGPDNGKIGVYQAGATDGRQTAANIVGLNYTFLPWQLNERDVEVSAIYICVAKLAKCFEYDAAGAPIALTAAVADAMRNTRNLDCMFV